MAANERMTEKESLALTGCWVDGARGWTANWLVVEIAVGRGWELDEVDGLVLAAYKRGQGTCWFKGEKIDVIDAMLRDGGVLDEAIEWLNQKVVFDGWSFGLCQGDFLLQTTEWWETEGA